MSLNKITMNSVFRKTLKKPVGKRLVFIGSPGVGKSLVCVFSALHMAAVENRVVVYT